MLEALQYRVHQSLQQITHFDSGVVNAVLNQAADTVCGVAPSRVATSPWQDMAIVKPFRHVRATDNADAKSLFDAWRHWSSFQAIHRTMQKRSRTHRRQKLGELLMSAEAAASARRSTELYQVVRKLAPKSVRRSWQFREQGKLMSPQAEVQLIAENWAKVFDGGETVSPTPTTCVVTANKVAFALSRVSALKAVPPHCAPAILWKACSAPVSAWLSTVLLDQWQAAVTIPAQEANTSQKPC